MKMLFLLMTFILSSFHMEVLAQEDEGGIVSREGKLYQAKLSRYQIGINSQFAIDELLDQSVRTPLEVLIRRQTAAHQALRIKLAGIFQNNQRQEVEYLSHVESSTLGLALGYEWQRKISGRWSGYLGFDLEAQRLQRKETEDYNMLYEYTNENFAVYTSDEQKTTRYSLLPLIGFGFDITPRLRVSTELKLEAFTEEGTYTGYYHVRSIDSTPEYEESSSQEITVNGKNINFQPYSGIFINLLL